VYVCLLFLFFPLFARTSSFWPQLPSPYGERNLSLPMWRASYLKRLPCFSLFLATSYTFSLHRISAIYVAFLFVMKLPHPMGGCRGSMGSPFPSYVLVSLLLFFSRVGSHTTPFLPSLRVRHDPFFFVVFWGGVFFFFFFFFWVFSFFFFSLGVSFFLGGPHFDGFGYGGSLFLFLMGYS